ncbi:MAG TPA: hypothetical protein VF043_03425 [Ktedonobacteraceae bacterium]
MKNNSSTTLERDVSAEQSPARHPIFQLVRPAVVVGCLYVLLIGLDFLINHHYAIYYVHIGPRFVLHDPRANAGYDGQFYYQIAHDPLHAAPFLDKPAYRYQRIVYPLLVAALSFGQAGLIPYMLLLVNFVSIVLGTELFARQLIKKNLSPWYSLAFGLYFGQATAFLFDLTEPLTYFLVCLGLFLLFRKRPTFAAIIWGLAVLSRETAILFPLGYIAMYLYQRRWQDATRFFLLSIIPTVAWYFIVGQYFHTNGLSGAPPFERIPFQGLFYFYNDRRLFWMLIFLMFIPTLLSIFLAVKEVFQHRWKNVSWLIWLLNLILVISLSRFTYAELVSAGRLSIGLVLAMLLHGLYTRNKTILWASQLYVLTFLFYAIVILYIAPV